MKSTKTKSKIKKATKRPKGRSVDLDYIDLTIKVEAIAIRLDRIESHMNSTAVKTADIQQRLTFLRAHLLEAIENLIKSSLTPAPAPAPTPTSPSTRESQI